MGVKDSREAKWIDGLTSDMDLIEGTSSLCIWKPRKVQKGKSKEIEPHKKSKYLFYGPGNVFVKPC